MSDKKLPIELLSIEEFESFKKNKLESEVLTIETLEEIQKLFSVGEDSTGRLCCDDYHPHSYGCNYYYNSSTGVVDRLIGEIERYHAILDNVREASK